MCECVWHFNMCIHACAHTLPCMSVDGASHTTVTVADEPKFIYLSQVNVDCAVCFMHLLAGPWWIEWEA